MFWKKKSEDYLTSKEYESISRKVTDLSSEIDNLKNKFKILETNYDNLRGNFNRKLNKLKEEEPQEEDMGEQSINNPVILPENGSFIKRR